MRISYESAAEHPQDDGKPRRGVVHGLTKQPQNSNGLVRQDLRANYHTFTRGGTEQCKSCQPQDNAELQGPRVLFTIAHPSHVAFRVNGNHPGEVWRVSKLSGTP